MFHFKRKLRTIFLQMSTDRKFQEKLLLEITEDFMNNHAYLKIS